VRVREVQVHGHSVDVAEPGRVALNVAGSDAVSALSRGVVLTTDPAVVGSDRLLAALRAHGEAPIPSDRARVVLHLGTVRVPGVVGRSPREAIDLGDRATAAVLRLERPIAVAPGDRFVLRRPSPAATVAGGRVLDPDPVRGIARRRLTAERLGALGSATTGSAVEDARLEIHGALPGSPPRLAGDVASAIDGVVMAAVGERGAMRTTDLIRLGAGELRRHIGGATAGLDRAAAEQAVRSRIEGLIATGRLAREADRVRLPGVSGESELSPAVVAAMAALESALSVADPPSLAAAAHAAGCPPEGVRTLERERRIVRVADDLAWSSATYAMLTQQALTLARAAPLTPAAFRDATGTSRKYVMAILEDLDRRAVLRRTPAGHVPGTRAATALPGLAAPSVPPAPAPAEEVG
jgi:selenocysteine-specific elongation factor